MASWWWTKLPQVSATHHGENQTCSALPESPRLRHTHTKLETSTLTYSLFSPTILSVNVLRLGPLTQRRLGLWGGLITGTSLSPWVVNQLRDKTESAFVKIFHVLLIKPRLMEIDFICRQTDFLKPDPRMRHLPVQSQPKLHHLKPVLMAWKSWGGSFLLWGRARGRSWVTCAQYLLLNSPNRLNHYSSLGRHEWEEGKS